MGRQKVLKKVLILSFFILLSCSSAWAETGSASYYTNLETHNRKCADGKYHKLDSEMVCASWFFDFGQHVRVVCSRTGKSIIVTCVDRGPAKRLVRRGRIIDLSACAFKILAGGKLDRGLLQVEVTKI
jgi:rare lipoprotein A (peptidoglycan hydrolase)